VHIKGNPLQQWDYSFHWSNHNSWMLVVLMIALRCNSSTQFAHQADCIFLLDN